MATIPTSKTPRHRRTSRLWDDVNNFLRATATYTDGYGEDDGRREHRPIPCSRGSPKTRPPSSRTIKDDALTSVDRAVEENTTSESGNPDVGDAVDGRGQRRRRVDVLARRPAQTHRIVRNQPGDRPDHR